MKIVEPETMANMADKMIARLVSAADTSLSMNEEQHRALQAAWLIFDQLGAHHSDDELLEVLRSEQFSKAAYAVRMAMLKAARKP